MKLSSIVFLAFFVSTSIIAQDGTPLTGDQIKELFVGKTFNIHNLETGKKLQAYTPDESVYLVNIHWKNNR